MQCSYENTGKNSSTHKHTNQINPQSALPASISLFLSISPRLSLSLLVKIIYISLSVFLKAQTQYAHTPTHRQAVRGTKK